jgi:hypothetical protein
MPPYTHHTYRLQDLIRQVAASIVQLEAPLEDWSTRPERSISFDTATPVALARWLDRALRDLACPPPPLEENLAEVTRRFQQTGPGPSSWFQAPARPDFQ